MGLLTTETAAKAGISEAKWVVVDAQDSLGKLNLRDALSLWSSRGQERAGMPPMSERKERNGAEVSLKPEHLLLLRIRSLF